jgi:PAS domain S-box-containing protein
MMNAKALELTGLEGIGSDFSRFRNAGAKHTDGRPYAVEDYPTVRAMITGKPVPPEQLLFTRPNGSAAVFEVSSTPVRDSNGSIAATVTIFRDTSQEQRAAAQLRESERKFRILADTMPQMVWSTLPAGYHDYYNRRWYEFTGVPEGSTDGEAWNGMFHPDDQPRAWARWRRSLATGEPYEIEYRLRHRSGEYRWVLGRALPIRNEKGEIERWFGTCTDIDEFKRTAEALRASEEFVRRVLESSDDCIKVLDLEAKLQFMSAGGLRVMEIDDFAKFEGCDWFAFWDGPDGAGARAAFELAKNGGTGRFQGFTPTAKGTPKWWDVVVTPINGPDGKPERILSISRDVTEQKRQEDALELLNREMDHRIKNLFAVATSLTTLAAREATTPKELALNLSNRFAMLHRAHGLVRRNEKTDAATTLDDLIVTLLGPYRSTVGDDRIDVACPDLAVGPQAATAIALVLHELATNAAKYGALSTRKGCLSVRCAVEGARIRIVWREQGVTVARRDGDQGFGSALVRRSVASQLNGEVTTAWGPDGITVTVTTDANRLSL